MDVVQDFFDEVQRREHALLEARVGVGFAQDPDPVAETEVVVVEPRAVVEGVPTAGVPIPRGRVPVVVVLPAVPGPDLPGHMGKESFPEKVVDLGRRVGMERGRVGDVVGVPRPVRRMQIDGYVRIVFAEQPRHRPRFGRVELHVVAVQVIALSVRPLTHPSDRPVLTAAVREAHPFVAVSVVDGRDQQDHRLPPFTVAAGQEVAEQHLERLLPAHLAAVDVALQVDDGLAGRPNGLRTRVSDIAHHGQGKRPSLVRVAVRRVVDRRIARRRALEEVHNLGVRTRLPVRRPLSAGEKRLVRGRRTSAPREHGRDRRPPEYARAHRNILRSIEVVDAHP